MMKLILVAALVASACADVSHLARPHQGFQTPFGGARYSAPAQVHSASAYGKPEVRILRLDQDVREDGSYNYAYETENGIAAQEQGQVRAAGQDVVKSAQGSYSWTSPEGVPVSISYVADENGYQAAGSAIPTPPPTPEAIVRALQWIAAHPEPQQQQYQQYQQPQQYRRF